MLQIHQLDVSNLHFEIRSFCHQNQHIRISCCFHTWAVWSVLRIVRFFWGGVKAHSNSGAAQNNQTTITFKCLTCYDRPSLVVSVTHHNPFYLAAVREVFSLLCVSVQWGLRLPGSDSGGFSARLSEPQWSLHSRSATVSLRVCVCVCVCVSDLRPLIQSGKSLFEAVSWFVFTQHTYGGWIRKKAVCVCVHNVSLISCLESHG